MCFCSMRLSTLAVSTWWSSLFLTAEWAAASLLLYSPSNCRPTASFLAAMMSCQAVACSCTACSPLIWARQASISSCLMAFKAASSSSSCLLIASVGGALCLDKIGHHDGEAHAHVKVVLHDEVFLGRKEGGDSEESHVGASHASLGVESVEPLSREDQRLHGSPLNWPLAGREVDKVPLGKSWCGGQLPGSGEAAGHHGRSDGKPGEHDGSGGEELLDEGVLDALT